MVGGVVRSLHLPVGGGDGNGDSSSVGSNGSGCLSSIVLHNFGRAQWRSGQAHCPTDVLFPRCRRGAAAPPAAPLERVPPARGVSDTFR
uniref:Uncharacterized protein n=1 Tax=Vespula pensylvanica TaxID=30213 RepID=A0A834PD43_VESPE|nr:hypothetical protein H0235_004137 [Vespula pensylvanica]